MSNLFKYTKRVLTSVLAAALVVTAIPSTAFGAEIVDEDIEVVTLQEDAQESEVTEAGAVEEDAFTVDGASGEEIIEEEENEPDKTAQDVEIGFNTYQTYNSWTAPHGNVVQGLIISDYYGDNYKPLYDGDNSDTAGIAWDRENDYSFFLTPVEGYQIPGTAGDTGLYKTVKISYTDATGKATQAEGTDKAAVGGTDFTVGAADKNGHVLVTIKSSFLKAAYNARGKDLVDAKKFVPITVDVDTVAEPTSYQFVQSSDIKIEGDGSLMTIGTDKLKAEYGKNFILNVDKFLSVASKKPTSTPVSKIEFSYVDKLGKTQTLEPGTDMATVNATTWTGTDAAKLTYYKNNFDYEHTSGDIIFALHHDIVEGLIAGDITKPVVTITFKKAESTKMKVKVATGLTSIANYHVGLAAANATETEQKNDLVISFKGKNDREIEKAFYSIDGGEAVEVHVTQQTNTSSVIATDNTWNAAASTVADIPQYWYYATIPAGKVVGSEMTLSVQTAEALSFDVDDTSGNWNATIESANQVIAVGGSTSPIETDEVSTTNKAYSFTVTPVAGRAVDTVKYTVLGGTAQTLTPAADGITYTIEANKINKPTQIDVTTKASSDQKTVKIGSSSPFLGTGKVTTMAGDTISTSGGPFATDGEVFYFKAIPDANMKITKIEYNDAGTDTSADTRHAVDIISTVNGVITAKTSAAIQGTVTLYVTQASGVTVTKPVNKMVTFEGDLNPTQGSEYTFTVKPVASSIGETRIISVSYTVGGGSPVVVYNNKIGKTGSHTATLNASGNVVVFAETKVVVNKAKYKADFKEDFPEKLGEHDHPNVTVSGGKYTLELSNGEAKEVGPASSGTTKNLRLEITDATSKQEIATITDIDSADLTTISAGDAVFTLAGTTASTKVAEIDDSYNKITANKKKGNPTTDTLTVTTWLDDSANSGLNQFEYTAELGIKVDERFSEVKLLSENKSEAEGKATYGKGILVKGSSERERLYLYGIDGRTGEPGLVYDYELWQTVSSEPTKKGAVWTVSPDFTTKAAKAYSYALSGSSDDNTKTTNTITYVGDSTAEIPASFTVTTAVKDAWGTDYTAATATVTLLDDPKAFVMIPTYKRANSAETRGYKSAFTSGAGSVLLEADAGINSTDVNFEIYQQAKDSVSTTLHYNSSKEDVVAAKKAGDYKDALAGDVTVTWNLYNLVYDHMSTGAPATADFYYDNSGVWTLVKGPQGVTPGVTEPTMDSKKMYKLVKSSDKAPNEYVTVTGSGLSWKISAIKGAEHTPTTVAATIAEPVIKIGDFGLAAFDADFATSNGSLEVSVGGRIEKDLVRLFVNDNTQTTGEDNHVVEQKLQDSWLNAVGVSSVITTNYAKGGGATAEGYSVGYEFPEVTDGTYFKLPNTGNFVAANVPSGRFIYGWRDDADNYYDVDEEVEITGPTATNLYALWGPKYIVEEVYNDNLTNKDDEGKDVISGAVDAAATFKLNYDGGETKAVMPIGVGVTEVKGIISTKDALIAGTAGYADLADTVYTTAGVTLTESDGAGKEKTAGKVLVPAQLTSGKVEFNAVESGTHVQAAYKKDNVSYTWNGAYTDAVPAKANFTNNASIAGLTNYMAVGTSGKPNNLELGIAQVVDVNSYDLTLSDVASMKANTSGVDVTATLKAGVGDTKTVVPYWGIIEDESAATNVYPGTYTWTSSNESVATVTQTPKVEGTHGVDEKISDMNKAHINPKSPGNAAITFTFKDPSGIERKQSVNVTVTAQTTFIKFADKDGKVIADPEFIETWTGSTRTNTFYVVATNASGTVLTGGTFDYSTKDNTYVNGIAFADHATIPGLNIATITGQAAFGKDTITLRYTDTDSSIVTKEVPFKTYDKLEFSDHGTAQVKSYEIGGVTVVDEDGKPETTKKPFIKVYSDDVKKVETVPAVSPKEYDWSYEIDMSRYTATPKAATDEFKGWYLKGALSTGKAKDGSKADGAEVDTTNTSAVKGKIVIYNTTSATADNTEFAVPADVVMVPYFASASITNVSGIPGTTVKLSDAVTKPGVTATSYKEINLGITPGTTDERITARAEDEGILNFLDNYDGSAIAAYDWETPGTLGTADWLELSPNNNAVQGTRTDKLVVGMIPGKAGKTKVNITTGAGANLKVLGSFDVAVSGAKLDGTGKIVGYYDENGELLKNDSKVISGVTYYFDEEGKVVTDGIVKLADGWVLIAGGVKESAAGLHNLAGKTYLIKADGTIAHGTLETVSGKQYLFREDGTMVKHTDADVIGGKIAVPAIGGPVYVIDDDDTAALDDILYNPQVTWVAKFPSKWDKKDAIPVVAYQVTVTSANTGKTKTTDSTVAAVAPTSVAPTATEVTFTATADLSAYFQDKAGTKKAENVTISKTYKFAGGGEEGQSGQEVDPEGDITIEGLEDSYPWTGKQIKPTFSVYDSVAGKYLAKGVDYTVKYGKNKDAGTKAGSVTITGKGNYAKAGKAAEFDIKKEELSDPAGVVKSIGKLGAETYTGSPIYPKEINVTLDGGSTVTMKSNGDGTYYNEDGKELAVSVTNNVDKGSATVAVWGAKNKNGKEVVKTATFKINAKSMEGANATGADGNPFEVTIDASADYRIKNTRPNVSIKFNGNELIEGQDYKVAVNVKKAKVTVTGKNNFTKKFEQSFTINKLSLAECEIAAATVYAGAKPSAVKVTILDPNGDIVPTKNYTLNVTPDSDALDSKGKLIEGKNVHVKATGKGDNVDSETYVEGDFTVAANLGKAKVTVPKTLTKTYTGSAIVLEDSDFGSNGITVTLNGKTLEKDTDFEVTGYQNNVKKGTMTVYIAGKGDFSGTKNFKVKIVQKAFGK